MADMTTASMQPGTSFDEPMLSGATGTSIGRWNYSRNMFRIPLFEHSLELTTNEILLRKRIAPLAAIPRGIIGLAIGSYLTFLGGFAWYYAFIWGGVGMVFGMIKPLLVRTFDTTVIPIDKIQGISSSTAIPLSPIRLVATTIAVFVSMKRPKGVDMWSHQGVAYGMIGVLCALTVLHLISSIRTFDNVAIAVGGAAADSDSYSISMDKKSRKDIREKLTEAISQLRTHTGDV